MLDNIFHTEQTLARLLAELKKDGLASNTIVTADHGDGLPRAKRSLYDSGLNVPFMVRWPDGRGAGTRNGELVSFVDIAPTVLDLAGIEVPPLQSALFAGDRVRHPSARARFRFSFEAWPPSKAAWVGGLP